MERYNSCLSSPRLTHIAYRECKLLSDDTSDSTIILTYGSGVSITTDPRVSKETLREPVETEVRPAGEVKLSRREQSEQEIGSKV